MTPINKIVEAVVIDASVAVAISARESDKEQTALGAIEFYKDQQCLFFAPGAIFSESLYVLCKQVDSGKISHEVHALAIEKLAAFLSSVLGSSQGDASLIKRADAIRGTYSCRRSADGLYIALAEQLSTLYETILLTFDEDMPNKPLDTRLLLLFDCSLSPHDLFSGSVIQLQFISQNTDKAVCPKIDSHPTARNGRIFRGWRRILQHPLDNCL